MKAKSRFVEELEFSILSPGTTDTVNGFHHMMNVRYHGVGVHPNVIATVVSRNYGASESPDEHKMQFQHSWVVTDRSPLLD